MDAIHSMNGAYPGGQYLLPTLSANLRKVDVDNVGAAFVRGESEAAESIGPVTTTLSEYMAEARNRAIPE